MKTSWLTLLALPILGSACASTSQQLELAHTPEALRRGALAEAPPSRFTLGDFEDARRDRQRIGWVRNGWGDPTATVAPSAPVEETIRGALQRALMRNEHKVGPQGDWLLDGVVTEFWVDFYDEASTIDYLATVEMELRLRRGASGEIALQRHYVGHYIERSWGGAGWPFGGGLLGGSLEQASEATNERVANLALDRMIDAFVLDTELRDILLEGPDEVDEPAASEGNREPDVEQEQAGE